jgi:hypothetical protein
MKKFGLGVFFGGERVNQKLQVCKAGALLLKPHLHIALVILEIGGEGSHELFAQADLEL